MVSCTRPQGHLDCDHSKSYNSYLSVAEQLSHAMQISVILPSSTLNDIESISNGQDFSCFPRDTVKLAGLSIFKRQTAANQKASERAGKGSKKSSPNVLPQSSPIQGVQTLTNQSKDPIWKGQLTWISTNPATNQASDQLCMVAILALRPTASIPLYLSFNLATCPAGHPF